VLTAASEGPSLTAQAELIPLVHDKRALAGRATAYVCEARVCALPTSDPAVLKAQLAEVYPLAAATRGSVDLSKASATSRMCGGGSHAIAATSVASTGDKSGKEISLSDAPGQPPSFGRPPSPKPPSVSSSPRPITCGPTPTGCAVP